jgi:hypothetical protein
MLHLATKPGDHRMLRGGDIESLSWTSPFSFGRDTNRDRGFTGCNGNELRVEDCR